MADEPPSNAGIEYDCHTSAGFRLARSETADSAFACGLADRFRLIEIGKEDTRIELVVAFHGRSVSSDDADRPAKTRSHIGSGKAIRGNKNEAGHTGGCSGGAGVAHALHRECRLLDREGVLRQRGRIDLCRIVQIKIRNRLRQILGIGKRGKGIFG